MTTKTRRAQRSTKKILVILSVLSVLVVNSSGQITFQKIYGGYTYEYAFDAATTSDGGCIMAGFTMSFGSGGEDMYIVKTDSSGQMLWSRVFGGTGNERAISISETSDHGYIAAGSTTSFGGINGDVYVVKIDSVGNLQWNKMYGGNEADNGSSIRQTSDGGYIISGNTFSFGVDTDDVYLIKTDAAGDLIWTKSFGGTGYDNGNCVRETNDGGFIIAGATTSFGVGLADVLLIKTDSLGDTLWTKTYGGVNTDIAYGVRETFDGGFIIVGVTQSFGPGNPHVYLIKTDASGDTSWTRTFGGNFIDVGKSVEQTSDSGYIVGATSASFGNGYQCYLVKLKSNGDTLWARTFSNQSTTECTCAKQTPGGGFLIAAYSTIQATDFNFYLIRTDENGMSGCYEDSPVSTMFPWSASYSPVHPVISSPNTQFVAPITLEDSGGVENILCSSVLVFENRTEALFSISPNPTNKCVEISSESGVRKIEIFSLHGKKEYSSEVSSNQQIINVESLSQGIYFVKVETENGASVQKLVKQ